MPIYEKPTKELMNEWAHNHLSHNDTFNKETVVRWFNENYPRIKSATVKMHVEGMSVNNKVRRHHPSIKPHSGHDLFYKLGPNSFRLWNPEQDPAPKYKDDFEKENEELSDESFETENKDQTDDAAYQRNQEFAFERDLRNYLSKNLDQIETGLRIYEEEGLKGIEFPVGGRFIDILAVDKDDNYVVIELKVSRGYDRVVGQILRYMGWIESNFASGRAVRGVIVAHRIDEDLVLAANQIGRVKLFEYKISFSLKKVL